MLKNQRGTTTLLDTMIIIAVLLLFGVMFFYAGKGVGHEEAVGTPIQFKELEKNVSYTLLERLPSSNNLSIIRQMEQSSEEFSQKVVVGLPPEMKMHDRFILRGESEIYLLKKGE